MAGKGRPLIDLSGMQFGDYKIVRRTSQLGRDVTYWECKCVRCGKTVVRESYDIRKGKVIACPCRKLKGIPAKHVPKAFRKKYGCHFCADKKECKKEAKERDVLICRYADEIDKYGSFDSYCENDKVIKRLLRIGDE